MTGYIKLHRKFLQWEWYDEPNAVHLFLHLLLTVNYEEKKWHGITVKPGELVTSYKSLAEETRLSVQNVRTLLNKLKSTRELTIKTNNKYSIISIVKWSEYQQINNQPTSNQQTTNKQLTTTKESKEVKEIKNKEYMVEFEAFWKTYPKRGTESKSETYEEWKKSIKETTVENIMSKLDAYCKTKDVREGFQVQAQRWLKRKMWEAEIEKKESLLEKIERMENEQSKN